MTKKTRERVVKIFAIVFILAMVFSSVITLVSIFFA